MLEENKKKILDRNYYLNKRSDARKKYKFLKQSHINLIIGCILGFFIVVACYFISDYSKLYHYTIEGNKYLSDSYIASLSGINEDTRYLLLLGSGVEKRIEKSPYIKSCSVELLDGRLARISVVENKALGYIVDGGVSYLLLDNDERVEIGIDNVYIVADVPLIEGYDEEGVKNVIYYLAKVDSALLNEISEIHRYPFSYDDKMMEVIMRDGNYVFVSPIGISMLTNYYPIISSLGTANEEICLYLDEVSNSGYVSACPWEYVEPEIIEEPAED